VKNLKLVSIVTLAAAIVAVSTPAAAHGPRDHFPAHRKADGARPVQRVKVTHVAGPRGTIVVTADDREQLASVDGSDCSGHRAGPRHTVCL